MLKVTAIVDKEDTAIDRLAKGMIPYMNNLDYQVVAVHPKKPSQEQLDKAIPLIAKSDILDFQYFRTAEMLRAKTSFIQGKKQILTHHNPYSITESNWNDYDAVVANNETIHKQLGEITQTKLEYIPNTVDTDFWTFKRDWEPKPQALMVAARIESKKGILDAAQACREAGIKLILVGSVSDPEYIHSVIQIGGVEFRENITDEQLRELYWESLIHICNSVDNFESGTNPIIEAMLTGCPVVTREVGHVPDLNNGENMFIHKGAPDDVKGLVEVINKAVDDPNNLKEIREKAWNSAKVRSNERRAYRYQRLYRSVMWPDQKSVSIIMPIYNLVKREIYEAIENQDYKNLELIIVDDKPDGELGSISMTCPVRYINTSRPENDYGLARARNTGIIEATGDILVFCDQRIKMEPNAVSEFVERLAPKTWVYGNKGVKKEFVENFSAVYRQDLIDAGMFNERIDAYGGMSQEIRSRVKHQGFELEYVATAKAEALGSSKNKYTKKAEIIRMKNRLYKMGQEI